MRKWMTAFLSAAMLVAASSCSKDETVAEPLAVTYASISGTWTLVELNGSPIDGDSIYRYLVIGRKADEKTGDRPFEFWQNLNSDKSEYRSGTYILGTEDESGNPAITGTFDHAAGDWSDDYIITDFTETSMTWTGYRFGNVYKYVRCDSVPEDIQAGTRSL